MKNEKKTKVFLVDDDAIFLKVLETQFKERTNYDVKVFSTGEECLRNLYQKPDIIFLDYYLNPENAKQTGLKILDKIKIVDPKIHVVMLSSQDSIELAINCMKHEAFDYIVKSEAAFMRAQKAIHHIFDRQEMEKELNFSKTASIILAVLVPTIILVAIYMQIHYPGIM